MGFSSYIRRVNIMLTHIDNAEMTENEKNHWKAVGYFSILLVYGID